jgi:hypothetical protein
MGSVNPSIVVKERMGGEGEERGGGVSSVSFRILVVCRLSSRPPFLEIGGRMCVSVISTYNTVLVIHL